MKFKEGLQVATAMTEGDEVEAGAEQGAEDEVKVDVEDKTEPTLEELLAIAEEKAISAEKEISYRDAEIQNVRKRMLVEKADAVQYASMGLARRMLAVLDDTDRALDTVGDDDDSSVADGLRLIRSRLWQELTAAGVSQISTDALFDPNLHEAIATIPATDEITAKSIVSVLEPGYRFKERIVKAARVVVAASPMSDSEE